jgi:cytochrome c-type biogenesis protein CcmE
MTRGEAAYETPVRLSGIVLPGTVAWDADALDLRFEVGDEATRIPVHSHGAPPQMFRAGMEVVVEGHYNRDGVFESRNLMVKHSNEYRAAEEGARPQDIYRDLIPEDGR